MAVSDDTLDLQFIGTATVLLRYGDLTLLTDPNFLHRGERAHLGYGLTSPRSTEPALGVTDLPPLDAVVLSHLHGDHWDRTARRHLDRTLPIVTTPHAARRLSTWQGFHRAGGLRTWESCTFQRGGSQVRITALPGRHSLHPVLRRLLPPVMGSLLEFGSRGGTVGIRLYVSGDTLLYDGLDEIARRFPGTDLAVLHLGGTRLPGGFVVTMDGAQGAELARRLGFPRIMPVHYDDYPVFRSPLADFRADAERLGLGDRLVHCPRGRHALLTPGSSRPAVR
ncbi:MBL fold metallo-hydrolase [Streptomyces sp. NPDC048192]|jgi:L-ascorbate metabolism protein UlaG (beta-lactamase superfamily)|uniref:MBL fold metallo-hydrolase n=1 Tax=unclassified Streptomyces TaxID=2593676 RepID=UPI00371929BC